MSKTMTKADIVAHVADKAGVTKAAANDAVDAFIGAIEKGLKSGEVRVAGLGTFKTRTRAARMGRNPQTGAPMKIKASKSVGFKAAKNLKEAAR